MKRIPFVLFIETVNEVNFNFLFYFSHSHRVSQMQAAQCCQPNNTGCQIAMCQLSTILISIKFVYSIQFHISLTSSTDSVAHGRHFCVKTVEEEGEKKEK